MLTSALKTIVNRSFLEMFNTDFMKNIKNVQKSQLIFYFPVKFF